MIQGFSVSKRFFVTVPDFIGDALDRWATAERNKPTTLAAFLLEQVVRKAIDEGKIPPEPAKEAPKHQPDYRTIKELVLHNLVKLEEYGKISDKRLIAIRDGHERPTELEVARFAIVTGLSEDEIAKLPCCEEMKIV